MNREKSSRGGRRPKANPSNRRFVFYLTEAESIKLDGLFLNSGLKRRSAFLKCLLLERPIRIVKIDKALMDYYMRLTSFYQQFRAVGVNYNQIVKALKSNFSERRAMVLMAKLEKATFELVATNQKVIELTRIFQKIVENDSKNQ